MEHLRSQRRQLQHLIIRHLIQLSGSCNLSGICRVNTVHIRINLAQVGPQNRSQSYRRGIRTAPSQSGNILVPVDSLKSCNNHYFLLIQLRLNALRIHLSDTRISRNRIRADAGLPAGKRNHRISQSLNRHRTERYRNLLSCRQKHIHLSGRSLWVNLLCLLNQIICRIPLGRQYCHHLISRLICLCNDPCNIAQPLRVSHRGPAEFLYDQTHICFPSLTPNQGKYKEPWPNGHRPNLYHILLI